MAGGNLIFDTSRNFSVVTTTNCPLPQCKTQIYDPANSNNETVVIFDYNATVDSIGNYVQGNVYRDQMCFTESSCLKDFTFFGIVSSSDPIYYQNILSLAKLPAAIAGKSLLQ